MVRSSRLAAVLIVVAIVAVMPVPPARAAMSKPAWTAGDYWAYSLSAGPNVSGAQRIDVVGVETVTVNGVPYPSYRTLLDQRVVLAGPSPAYFNLTGASWYRTSDLAQVMLDVNGTLEMPPFISTTIWERVTWDPPLDILWPLIPGATWTATSWNNATIEVGGPPPIYTNVSLTTSFEVMAEGPVTVPAGTFPTTPLNATTGGYSNVTYWSPDVGNGVLIQSFDPMGAEMQRIELTSYRYQGGGPDTTPPAVADVAATPPTQTAGGTVTISANVTDNVGVASVRVNVTLPDGTSVNATMTRGAGDFYAYASTWSQVGTHTFVIWALDAAGNPASAAGSFEIAAGDLPPTITLTSPVGGEDWSGGSVHPLAYVTTDPDDPVLDIMIEYSLDDGVTWNPAQTIPGQPPGTYSYSWVVPIVDTTTARLRACASDRTNPPVCDTSGRFTIDSTRPSIAGVAATPPNRVGAGSVALSATVTDNIAVSTVSVDVTLPDGSHANRTMVRGAGDAYAYTASWSQVGAHPFVVWASDTAGNWASATGSFTIAADTTPPSITPSGPDAVYVGDTITINATVTDADGVVQEVRLVYTPVGGTERNVTMTLSGGVYTYTIPAQSGPGTVRYRVYAVDSSGNAKLTQEYTVEVRERPSAPGLDLRLIAAVVIILVVAILAAVMLVLRRRRKGRETPPASPP